MPALKDESASPPVTNNAPIKGYTTGFHIMVNETLKKIRLEPFLYNQPGWIYSVTVVTNFRTQCFSRDEFNREIIECLKSERIRCGCKVFVYCLMPEHLHFLTGSCTVENSVIDFVNQFKGKSTAIAWRHGVKGSLWQGRWHDHILRKDEDVQRIGEYILNNPVRRKLVEDWNMYPYCGYLDEFIVTG